MTRTSNTISIVFAIKYLYSIVINIAPKILRDISQIALLKIDISKRNVKHRWGMFS